MKNHVVIGLGFGDEGKGTTVSYLCDKLSKPLVIRFSGGHQAGHTVVRNGVHHVFSNFGSGTLQNKQTYWSKYCTIDPIGIENEFNCLLKDKISPILYIDEKCPITTPWDKNYNRIRESERKHGSCGIGYAATIEREEFFYSLTYGDLFYRDIFLEKLNLLKNNYYKYTKDMISLDEELLFIQVCDNIKNYTFKSFGIPKGYNNYIFEGSQGLLLDQHFGFFPHVTRSNTGLKNVVEMIGENLNLYLVTRAYQTRHGNGFMSNVNLSHKIKYNENETNVTNKYQGEFRRTLLDVSLLEYAINKDEYIRKNKNKNLIITCLDHIQNDLRFTCNGNMFVNDNEDQFIKNISNILKIKNVYISKSDESINIKKWRNKC
jgi:adenylosuccinate synthase